MSFVLLLHHHPLLYNCYQSLTSKFVKWVKLNLYGFRIGLKKKVDHVSCWYVEKPGKSGLYCVDGGNTSFEFVYPQTTEILLWLLECFGCYSFSNLADLVSSYCYMIGLDVDAIVDSLQDGTNVFVWMERGLVGLVCDDLLK